MSAPNERIARDVAQFGWHVVLVAANDEQPALAYTVGLHRSYDHPEICVLGLADPVAHALLNDVGDAVRNGARFADGARIPGLIRNYDVCFKELPHVACGALLCFAHGFYGAAAFPALQLVWPDALGRFPWDGEVAESARELQAIVRIGD